MHRSSPELKHLREVTAFSEWLEPPQCGPSHAVKFRRWRIGLH
jgi:hypothetical protein